MKRPLLFTLLQFLVYFANATLYKRQTNTNPGNLPVGAALPANGVNENQNASPGVGASGAGLSGLVIPGATHTCGIAGPECPGFFNLITSSVVIDMRKFCAQNCKMDCTCASFAYHVTQGFYECRLYADVVAGESLQACISSGIDPGVDGTDFDSYTYYDANCPDLDQYNAVTVTSTRLITSRTTLTSFLKPATATVYVTLTQSTTTTLAFGYTTFTTRLTNTRWFMSTKTFTQPGRTTTVSVTTTRTVGP